MSRTEPQISAIRTTSDPGANRLLEALDQGLSYRQVQMRSGHRSRRHQPDTLVPSPNCDGTSSEQRRREITESSVLWMLVSLKPFQFLFGKKLRFEFKSQHFGWCAPSVFELLLLTGSNPPGLP